MWNLRKYKPLAYSILISLAVGTVSGLITMGAMQRFAALRQPPLSPPGWLFPVVWSILYILMGVSAWLVLRAGAALRDPPLRVYAWQLAVNFFWSIFFFSLQWFLFSFFWLLLLLLLIAVMLVRFRHYSRPAALLQIPYLLWCLFAAYLNLGVYLLNR